MSDDLVTAARIAAMQFAPKKKRPARPELISERARRAKEALARIEELLAVEEKRHRRLARRLRTLRRKARARVRYYSSSHKDGNS